MEGLLGDLIGKLPLAGWLAAAAAATVLGALLLKILRSEEGFLFGYGNWTIGKWQPSSRSAPAESAPVVAAAVVSAPAPVDERRASARDAVLTLSRLLDGDLAYILINQQNDWDAAMGKAIQRLISGVTRVMYEPERCRAGFFRLADDDETTLVMVAGEGYGPLKRPRLHVENSCGGRAFVTGENYYCRDIETDPVYRPSVRDKRDFRSIACIPVRAGTAVFGVICLDAPEANVFTADDFEHLNVLASKLAVFCSVYLLRAELQESDNLP